MNYLKLLRQSGRREIVRNLLDENLTEDLVYGELAEASTKALEKAGVAEDKRKAINGYVNDGADIVTAIVEAAKDNVITADEMKDILTKLLVPFGQTVSGVLENAKDVIVSKVP